MMEEDFKNILRHLLINQGPNFFNRTERSLRNKITLKVTELEYCLTELNRNDYVRCYMHPSIGLVDRNVLEPDLKVIYAISERGVSYLESIEAEKRNSDSSQLFSSLKSFAAILLAHSRHSGDSLSR